MHLYISKCVCLCSSRKVFSFLSLNFPSACVCIFALGETWERPVSGQTRQTDGWTCQNVTKRGEGDVKNKGGQEEEKAERTWMVEKVERDGAPDLTTLTHSGLSLLASCALWSICRGHTRTHIYLSTHAGDEDILGLYACVCLSVCLDVTAYPCVLKRVWTLPKILPSVFDFLPAFVPLCSCPWTCMHICVCIRIFTRLLECAGAHFHLFFLLGSHERAGYWCVECPHVPLHHLSLFAVSPHVCHVCEPLAMSSTNGVIRNKCSKVQQLDPANPPKIPSHNALPHSQATVPTTGAWLLPNALVSANRNGATNRLCGHPVFPERAPGSADWPLKGLFLLCVEFCWTGSRDVQEMQHGQRVKEGKVPS